MRARARTRGIVCTISEADIAIPAFCPVFRTRFNLTSDPDQRNRWPSVDRINPRKGYTPDNVAVISMKANRLKSNMTPKEMYALLNYMESH